ncbi:hypothetical protein M231_03949 [Tremella mesenterica]|uniref:Uncharacterized protein n=1 Tax=Tremella mesenterica TaxID=5217 RepID=A0A4Q1BLU3_TREME|nr:uncharacterized protein TREMEDRAFT_64813 [Tremella mesenterica DSM 1558]EIW66954.1 hypothetical protein TREMEDRAFT_64813 [Tremella mesenterica DSM 1558]RXK38773.1 hypothetical protein M231_03949 [Tremella mesenterica]
MTSETLNQCRTVEKGLIEFSTWAGPQKEDFTRSPDFKLDSVAMASDYLFYWNNRGEQSALSLPHNTPETTNQSIIMFAQGNVATRERVNALVEWMNDFVSTALEVSIIEVISLLQLDHIRAPAMGLTALMECSKQLARRQYYTIREDSIAELQSLVVPLSHYIGLTTQDSPTYNPEGATLHPKRVKRVLEAVVEEFRNAQDRRKWQY